VDAVGLIIAAAQSSTVHFGIAGNDQEAAAADCVADGRSK